MHDKFQMLACKLVLLLLLQWNLIEFFYANKHQSMINSRKRYTSILIAEACELYVYIEIIDVFIYLSFKMRL